jgi:hypothetical protein
MKQKKLKKYICIIRLTAFGQIEVMATNTKEAEAAAIAADRNGEVNFGRMFNRRSVRLYI